VILVPDTGPRVFLNASLDLVHKPGQLLKLILFKLRC
jgi:hypothetical protein